ncbi:hypothetical protein NHQ30_008475 [Ciborinia camelliae]|nr:hypothetical protein NHQ30_008475 [Ciborinia camelliae]
MTFSLPTAVLNCFGARNIVYENCYAMAPIKSMIFKEVHEGVTVPGKDIGVETTEFDLEQSLEADHIIVQVLYSSFDPFMRGRMRAKTVFPPYKINKPIPALSIASIFRSSNPDFPAGQLFRGTLPISQYVHLTPDEIKASHFEIIKNPHNLDPYIFLGALGMPGLAAYASLLDIGKPKTGETLFVTAAAGAVGHIVGQLAKLQGCHVIGSAGSDEKVAWLTETLGFDGAFNYKTEAASAGLARLAPDGIDIYFDNTGGEQLDAALYAMRPFGRVVGCGMMSLYNRQQSQTPGGGGIHGMFNLVMKRLTMKGFIVSDPEMGPKYAGRFEEEMPELILAGKLKAETTLSVGVEEGPDGFVGMLSGKSLGKAVLKL